MFTEYKNYKRGLTRRLVSKKLDFIISKIFNEDKVLISKVESEQLSDIEVQNQSSASIIPENERPPTIDYNVEEPIENLSRIFSFRETLSFFKKITIDKIYDRFITLFSCFSL